MLRQGPRDEAGASAVEYGLLVVAIAAVIAAVVFVLGMEVQGLFTTTCTSVQARVSGSC